MIATYMGLVSVYMCNMFYVDYISEMSAILYCVTRIRKHTVQIVDSKKLNWKKCF